MTESNAGVFDPNVAALLDANCAIVYSKIRHCETNERDGRWWAAASGREWHEIMPYFTEKQIYRALDLLEKAGLVVTGNYNKNGYDRTKWYSTNPIPKSMRL